MYIFWVPPLDMFTGRDALDQTNHYRAQHRVPPLKWNRGAARHASSLARKIARTGTPIRLIGLDY